MSLNRRDFLKIAGGLTICGLSGKAALVALAENSGPAATAVTAKKLAMLVDIKKCLAKEGCRLCIETCHHNHNVPDFHNAKDEIKWIWKDRYEQVFPEQEAASAPKIYQGQSVPVMCNHCENPPCVRVCPVQATFKRPDGIVVVDYHRCMGCRYCAVACPYGARNFNWRDPRPFIAKIEPNFPTRTQGVVEKCTFCIERVDQNLLPACVEVCPTKALTFGNLADPASNITQALQSEFTMQRKPHLGTHPQVYYRV